MKNLKNIVKSIAVLSMLVGVALVSPVAVKAENNGMMGEDSNSMFMNARASLNAEGLIKLESTTGVVFGPNGNVRVLGAKVTSVSSSAINATATFGNSSLNFVVNVDANTKLNGKTSSSKNAPLISSLKVGDLVGFSGTMSSSSSSAIVLVGTQVVSRAFAPVPNPQNKTKFEGVVTAINTSDSSFTLHFKGNDLKVVTTSATLADLTIGDSVKVNGSLDSGSTTITATKVVIDNNNDDGRDNKNEDRKDNENRNNGSDNEGWFSRMTHWLFR